MSFNLDNLVKAKQLKVEPFDENEFSGLLKSGKARLKDASNPTLELESRFLLAYNAAHSLALAALRLRGYRADNRYIVFQALPYTLGVSSHIWRVLAKCHDRRNLAEYEGTLEMDEQILSELFTATHLAAIPANAFKKHTAQNCFTHLKFGSCKQYHACQQ